MRIFDFRYLAFALLIATAGLGCNMNTQQADPTLIPVKGKITYRGKLVTKGIVEFESRDFGRDAAGDIQPDGTYILTTTKEGDGIVAGLHRVSITGGATAAGDLLPKIYRQPNTSELTADVSAENTEFSFDLR